jgi:uncharacterized membrane protein
VNVLFVVIGAIALIAGLGMMTVAIRSGANARPRNTMLLMTGMMATAFGLILAGFAIGYATTKPLDLNSTGAL